MASGTYSHMLLDNPKPFPGETTSPIKRDQFPCQIGASGSYPDMAPTSMQAGSQQKLSFAGSAVHGGGSCQLSIANTAAPGPNDKFKVIHSIEGGCPGVSGAPANFTYTLPKDVPNGQSVIAWTWFNNIGNREMYMNCASITVTGGAGNADALNKLPDLFTANLDANDCKTVDNMDVAFPNPGNSLEKYPNAKLAPPQCNGQSQPGSGSGPAVPSAPAPSSAPAASSAPASSMASTPLASSVPASTLASFPAASTSKTPTSSSAQPSIAPPAPKNGTAPATPTHTHCSKTSCTTEGAVVCNGSDQWGLCDHGKVVFQPVAAGTACHDGKISKREVSRKYGGPRHSFSAGHGRVVVA
ncbi:lytic polysaccharide monooxygenase [Aulographum hederae CBS 113979]|uniref:Lytic polysaccharide monooxygenase n=1 Tax=Aulographum hederae CBS 113979 TaxID=1176131 RepID=A0A6G1GKE1_9PEZI|nr:lytic polysaccharide monooxygenase [Aulographum hederae CBS 113979]